MFKFLKNLVSMKTVKGLATMAIGVGISAIPVPGLQAVGVKVIEGGGVLTVAGLLDKGRKAVKAKKGERWIAVTEKERDAIKKARKRKDKK